MNGRSVRRGNSFLLLLGLLAAACGGSARGDGDTGVSVDVSVDVLVDVPLEVRADPGTADPALPEPVGLDLPGFDDPGTDQETPDEVVTDPGADEGSPLPDEPPATDLPLDEGPGDPGIVDSGEDAPGLPDPIPDGPVPDDQDTADPGTLDPGHADLGLADPGPDDPGLADPGPVDPGPVDPGAVDLGPVDPGCLPDCTGRTCGDDGCGGTCGGCAPDWSCVLGTCLFDGTCAAVPVPDPADPEPLAAMSPAGAVETLTRSGFTDDYLYDGTGLLKVGTRREWGASVVFFGMAAAGAGQNASNVIDANDTGREVQVALYDPDRQMQGCASTATCRTAPGTACPTSITFLGWNPVQGGNECNHGSPATTSASPGMLQAVVEPLHWNPDWSSATCANTGCSDPGLSWTKSDVLYTQRLRFVRTHVVEMQMTVQNLSDVDHAPTIQEFPTLYASWGSGGPDLDVILDSAGTQIPVDIPANDGFFYRDFESPGGFVSLQGPSREYGVGLYYENRLTAFQAWQKQAVFNNVRSRFPFGIPARGTVMARAYLILGSFATVAGEAAWLDAHLAPFGTLDAPAADAAAGGLVTVRGWSLDNRGVARVEVLLDGRAKGTLGYGTARPDVCKAWPGYPGCDAVGFEGTLDLSGETPCAHLLEIRATDTDGNVRVIARRRIQSAATPAP